MNFRTRVFMTLLQLAIGWHLLYEGLWKIQHQDAWSSKGYLRGASGPLALPIRWLAGDPEVAWQDGHFVVADSTASFLARFTVKPFEANETAATGTLHRYLPPPLEEEWQTYLERFIKHYHLDDLDRRDQRSRVENKLLICKGKTVDWLLHGTKKAKPPELPEASFPEVPKATPQRIQEYLDKLDLVRNLETQQVGFFGVKGVGAKLRAARAEANALREGLKNDLDRQTADMKKALREELTSEQRRMEQVADVASPVPEWPRLRWIDGTVRWGLTVIGACLLVGLFTRAACIGGALLLLLFYMAMPPLPGMPENPAAGGHYLFINNNIIEILALLSLATWTPNRRYGLDALWDSPGKWRRRLRNGLRIIRGDNHRQRPHGFLPHEEVP